VKHFFIPSLLLLSSCFTVGEQMVVQGPSAKKHKQRILVLQKKLEGAEKEHKKIQSDIETLQQEIQEAELALIRKQLDDYEKKGLLSKNLFNEERESLYRMIEKGPSASSFEAQIELDRILRIITDHSDVIDPIP
jgi:hypothetical protein